MAYQDAMEAAQCCVDHTAYWYEEAFPLDSIKSGDGVKMLREFQGEGRENNLKVEDGGLKVAIHEPVEEDSLKIL